MAKPTEGRTRTVMVAAIAVLVLGVLIGVWSFHRSADVTMAPPSKVASAQAPSNQGQSIATPASKVYDNLLSESNSKTADEAMKTGKSAMPVIRDQSQATGPMGVVTPVTAKPASTPAPQSNPQQDPRYQQALADREKAIKERRAAMAAQLNLLQKAWSVEGHVSMATHQASADASVAPAVPSVAPSSMAAKPSLPPLVHMGDTLVAVLDTPINTDSPLPMYKAHIVQAGPLQGATVLGTLQTNTSQQYGSGVSLTFTKASIPGQGDRDIQAIAVDANTGGALDGKVNNHTFQRYGAAFGGAFLNGVGQGLMQGGRQQQVITSTNGYAVQSNAFTNKQLLELGAASVGQTAATTMQRDISRPPTITVPAGTTIALMFTADVPASTSVTSTK